MKLEPAQQLLDEQPISVDVLLEKYAKSGEQSADDVRRRVARGLAAVEAPALRADWEKQLRDIAGMVRACPVFNEIRGYYPLLVGCVEGIGGGKGFYGGSVALLIWPPETIERSATGEPKIMSKWRYNHPGDTAGALWITVNNIGDLRDDYIGEDGEGKFYEHDKEKLQQRSAKLSGGVAIILVGAATETELKEKKHRVEDALSATRAAVEEGTVPGGGVALINAIAALKKVSSDEPDIQTGITIMRRALEEPMRRNAANAGQDGAVIIDTVRRTAKEKDNKNIGYNVLTGNFEDMVKSGIIDPAKVTRSAVENAASIAAMILTTDALITDVPEKNAAPTMPPGGGEY